MLFLKDTPPILAVANKICQKRGKLIHESYGKIMAVVKTMAEPIVRDETAVDLLSDDNLPHLFESKLSFRNCHGLLLETTHDLVRFPELEFVTQNLLFVDPRRRELIC